MKNLLDQPDVFQRGGRSFNVDTVYTVDMGPAGVWVALSSFMMRSPWIASSVLTEARCRAGNTQAAPRKVVSATGQVLSPVWFATDFSATRGHSNRTPCGEGYRRMGGDETRATESRNGD